MHRRHSADNQVVELTGPGPSDPRITRAGDADRQRVTKLLQAHYVAGRLSSGELEERIEQTLGATTLADLDGLLADLPRTSPPAGERSARMEPSSWSQQRCHGGEKSFRAHAGSYLMVMALLVTIWLLTTPGGYFWPVWPMLGWGIGLASHGLAARGLSRHQSALSQR